MYRIFIFFFTLNLFCQKSITKADDFIGIDIYENKYLRKAHKIIKHTRGQWLVYQNINLGIPTDVDISNPLQILVFYENQNKVIVLDNHLIEIDNFKVPNGTSLITNAGKDKIWIFNSINNTLNLYNFKNNRIEVSSLPLKFPLKKIKGNLNGCRAINTNKDWISFNYLGREAEKINLKAAIPSNSLLTFHKIIGNCLYFKDQKIITIEHNVKSFDIVYDNLFYFDGEFIYNTPIK